MTNQARNAFTKQPMDTGAFYSISKMSSGVSIYKDMWMFPDMLLPDVEVRFLCMQKDDAEDINGQCNYATGSFFCKLLKQ